MLTDLTYLTIDEKLEPDRGIVYKKNSVLQELNLKIV